MPSVTTEFKAWAAGLVDARGKAYLTDERHGRLRVYLPNEQVANQLKHVYGGSVYPTQTAKFATCVWQLKARDEVYRFIQDIHPHTRGQGTMLRYMFLHMEDALEDTTLRERRAVLAEMYSAYWFNKWQEDKEGENVGSR